MVSLIPSICKCPVFAYFIMLGICESLDKDDSMPTLISECAKAAEIGAVPAVLEEL